MKKETRLALFPRIHTDNFHRLCNLVAASDTALKSIIDCHGYPPPWTRRNTFASLIQIILEQQVSLASAKAAFNKLKQKIGKITPQNLLTLSDEELKFCYFSRQKIGYARYLAETILAGKINLRKFNYHPDEAIRAELLKLKGVGHWTIDVYLLFVLQRTDIFPVGDLAMIKALKEVKGLKGTVSKEEIIKIGEKWQPNRSIATMLLWHYYICTRNIKL